MTDPARNSADRFNPSLVRPPHWWPEYQFYRFALMGREIFVAAARSVHPIWYVRGIYRGSLLAEAVVGPCAIYTVTPLSPQCAWLEQREFSYHLPRFMQPLVPDGDPAENLERVES